MPKMLSTLGVVLMVAVIAVGVGSLGTPAFAKKPPPPPPAPVPETGQTTSYGARDDGAIQAGVPWPTPRFTDNGDGTVRDNLTGLIWLKQASCFGVLTWVDALTAANTLASGQCGLTDGSVAGDWRLPNVREFVSLIDFGQGNTALSNTQGTGAWQDGDPFFITGPLVFWSSTTVAGPGASDRAWLVVFAAEGEVRSDQFKSNTFAVWPVRGGR